MWSTLITFLRSFFSPRLYQEVAHGKDGTGFGYLFSLSLTFSIIALIITVILSFFAFGLGVAFVSSLPAFPAMGYVSGTFLFILSLLFKIFVAIAIAIINAAIFAIIIVILSCIIAIPGKILSTLLWAKLDYAAIVRLAAYAYCPAAIVFFSLGFYLLSHGKLEQLKPLYSHGMAVWAQYLPEIPNIIISQICQRLILLLLPFPLWLIYITYAVICSKFYFKKLKVIDCENKKGRIIIK